MKRLPDRTQSPATVTTYCDSFSTFGSLDSSSSSLKGAFDESSISRRQGKLPWSGSLNGSFPCLIPVAATVIQSLVRGWIERMKFKVRLLERRLVRISDKKKKKLDRFQDKIKLERERISRELELEILGKSSKEREAMISELAVEETSLRDANRELSDENETLRTASLLMADRNGQTIAMTDDLNNNFDELDKTIPRLEADNEKAQAMEDQWKKRTQEFQDAMVYCERHIALEAVLSQKLQRTIDKMMEKVETLCTDRSLKASLQELASSAF